MPYNVAVFSTVTAEVSMPYNVAVFSTVTAEVQNAIQYRRH